MNTQKFKENGNNKFPVSTDTFEFMQEQILLASKLSDLAGGNVIIKQSTASSDGLCIYNGELMPLKGTPDSHIILVTNKESITANGEIFRNVRTIKYAQYAAAGGSTAASFWTLTNLKSLKTQLDDAAKHQMPKGTIIDWYGSPEAENVPYGFVPCGMFGRGWNGDKLESEKAAWAAKYHGTISIQRTYTNGACLIISDCLGETVPNLTDRFIVQAGCQYTLGVTGGEKSHQISIEEIPAHRHVYNADSNGIDRADYLGMGREESGSLGNYSGSGSGDGGRAYTSYAGAYCGADGKGGSGDSTSNKKMDILPPYFALHKLIKVI